jgi:hypothetical protein
MGMCMIRFLIWHYAAEIPVMLNLTAHAKGNIELFSVYSSGS